VFHKLDVQQKLGAIELMEALFTKVESIASPKNTTQRNDGLFEQSLMGNIACSPISYFS
jgi:hypothetical protein